MIQYCNIVTIFPEYSKAEYFVYIAVVPAIINFAYFICIRKRLSEFIKIKIKPLASILVYTYILLSIILLYIT
jgi:hypothetical protein